MSTNNSQPSTARSILGLAVFLFIVGVVIYSCSTNGSSSDDSDTDDGGGSSMAEHMCEQLVTDRLKAPSTADFPGTGSVAELGKNKYQVQAAVDSENGFGATIRTGYVCTVAYTGGDHWQLESLDIDE